MGGLDPFDVDEPRTQYLYDASGWSRAWVAGLPWAGEHRTVHEAFPVDYRELTLLEKLAIVVNGVVLREWPETRYPTGRPVKSGVRRELWCYPYRLARQARGRATGFDSYEDAIATAVRPGPHPETVLVGRVLGHYRWPAGS